MDTKQETLDSAIIAAMVNAAKEVLTNKPFGQMIQDRMEKELLSLIEEIFRWGKGRDALKSKLEQMLVPTIEGYDLAKCNVKLEMLLDELIRESAVEERRQILEAARLLTSSEGIPSAVDADDLFDAYGEFVADEYDCAGRSVEEGLYSTISIAMRFEPEDKTFPSSRFERAVLVFEPTDEDDPNDSNAELTRHIRVSRYHLDDYWTIDELRDLSIADLRHLDAFMVRMATMAQWRTHLGLDGLTELDAEVEPSTEPELEYV